MKRQRDEEFARETFHEFLQGRGEAPLWESGSEPPDYFLALGDQRYCVEVTQVMEEFQLGGGKQTSRAIQMFLLGVAKIIEDEARSRGTLWRLQSLCKGCRELWRNSGLGHPECP